MQIDFIKLFFYYVKRIWIIALCAVIGYASMYIYTAKMLPDTYTAAGTMYVYNGNPNAVNYQYTSSSDLNSAVQLIDTYMVVIKSNKVLDAITERLAPQYPDITPGFISGSLSAGTVSETSVLLICRNCLRNECAADPLYDKGSTTLNGHCQCSTGCGSGGDHSSG